MVLGKIKEFFSKIFGKGKKARPPAYYPPVRAPPEPTPTQVPVRAPPAAPPQQPAAGGAESAAGMLKMAGPEGAVAGEAIEAFQKQMKQMKKEAKSTAKKTLKIMIPIMIIIIIAAVLFWYFFFTTTGSYVSAKTGGVTAPVASAFKGFTAPLNQFKMIMTGEYDPTEMFESKVYEDRYSVVKDVGVELENIRPAREYFPHESELSIVGNIKVVSLPENEKGVNAEITAREKQILGGNYAPLTSWSCSPGKDELTDIQRHIGRFECTHKSLLKTYQDANLDLIDVKEFETRPVEVSVEYNFGVKAGKQIYVAPYSEINNLFLAGEAPMRHYEISKDAVRSWQTKSPIAIGMGLLSGEDVIAANNDKNDAPYYIGITVKNNGDGVIPRSNKNYRLTMKVPEEVLHISDGSDFKPDTNAESVSGIKTYVKTFTVAQITERGKDFKPADYETFYFKFKVPESTFLAGAPLSSFFALAELDYYDYKDSRTITVQIKRLD